MKLEKNFNIVKIAVSNYANYFQYYSNLNNNSNNICMPDHKLKIIIWLVIILY